MNKLEATKQAIKITQACLTYIKKEIRIGMSEKQVSALISTFFAQHKAQLAFETLVCSGKRSSLFHGPTSTKKIAPNEPIYIDLGAKYKGYCADMTRTFFIGKPSKKFSEVYELVKQAQQKQARLLAPGINGKDVDLAGRELFKKHGLDKYFTHSTGHGIGHKVHQSPVISFKRSVLLKEGMIVTIEPGIYLPKEFGVRIEDMYLITATGAQRLTSFCRKLSPLTKK